MDSNKLGMAVTPVESTEPWRSARCRRDVLGTLLYAAIVLVVLAVQSWLLRGWVVDDAAISMSYARSLRHVFGLVA